MWRKRRTQEEEISDVKSAVYVTALNDINSQLPDNLKKPEVAIICGSGLGGLVDTIDETNRVEIKYEKISGFVRSTVQGHAGKLVFGLLGKNQTPTVCMVGRFHFYEGYTLEQITFPVRIFQRLGVKTLIVTNASGGLNKEFQVGDVMVLNDHISLPSLVGNNPLIGPNLDDFGPRFLPMTDVYDGDLHDKASKAAVSLNLGGVLKEGVYCFVSGPTYETKAEGRFLRTIGDVVGMSTVPEVIVARHCGIRVLGLSLVTNIVAVGEDAEKPPSHQEVLEVSQKRAHDLQNLVKTIVELI